MLSLLLLQIADRLNAAGVPCNLVTGQEVRLVHGARHTACTIEMADVEQRVEVIRFNSLSATWLFM
jgi:ATP-dependent RNA helicase SUPV3L1/SUV3